MRVSPKMFHALLATLILCQFSPAYAANEAPKTASELVALCKSDYSKCDNAVVTIELTIMTADIQRNTRSCVAPRGITHAEATRAIFDWLASNPQNSTMTAEDGVQAAVRGVWNCASKIDTGFTSSGVPDKIGRFISFCDDKSNYVKCANESINGGMNATMEIALNGSSQHCELPKGIKTEDVYAQIMPWLKAHRETHDLETDDGLATATDSLWPCKSR